MININFLLKISIHWQEKRLWEFIKWSPKRKYLDLLSNSLNSFFKEMYRDQFGEFVCWYWGLKGYIDNLLAGWHWIMTYTEQLIHRINSAELTITNLIFTLSYNTLPTAQLLEWKYLIIKTVESECVGLISLIFIRL